MAENRLSSILLSAQPLLRSCGPRLELLLARCMQPLDAFKSVSLRGRGRLVPAKRRASGKTWGRGRPSLIVKRTRRQTDNRAMPSSADLVGCHGKRAAARLAGLFMAILTLSGPTPGCAEGGSLWRIYPVTAGQGSTFTGTVTVSPRGNVWVRLGGDGPASWLDGLQVRTISFSGTGNFPVYESRSGQLWALFTNGVMEFRRDQW